MTKRNEPAHIILVDDQEAVTRFFQQRLTRLGYQVRCFQDPDEALKLLGSKGEAYDLVICDFIMPQMNGYDFVRAPENGYGIFLLS